MDDQDACAFWEERLDAFERHVIAVTARGGDEVVIRRRIAATQPELFDAWTDPEGMREWMCTFEAGIHLDLGRDLQPTHVTVEF